jgi:hypothetical protein
MAYLSGRAASKTRRSNMGRYLLLGALTPDQAAEQVFPAAKVRGGAGHNQQVRDSIVASVAAGQILSGGQPAYSSCAATGSGMLKPAILSQASGFSLKFAPQAFAAGPIVGGIVVAVGALTALFSHIFAHHAQAVRKEQSILCAAVPAANQSLQLIDQAVSSGQATPQQGIDAMSSLLAGFGAQVAAIRKGADPTSSGECNAACVMFSELRAIVAEKSSQYQDMAAAQAAAAANPAAAAAGAVSSAAATLGIPPWALYAAGGLLLWKLASA